MTRVVLAREVSMEELAEIRKRTDLEIEASFMEPCVFLIPTLNFLTMFTGMPTVVAQSCRWKYDL
ncbi:MAG: U32 family peptidase [Streptococcus salivarius]